MYLYIKITKRIKRFSIVSIHTSFNKKQILSVLLSFKIIVVWNANRSE